MSEATTYKGGYIGIAIKDPTTGTFSRPCGLTSGEISFSKDLSEQETVDCSDPEAVSWVLRGVKSFSMSASGEGLLASEAIDSYEEGFFSEDPVEARFYVGEATDTGKGRYWSGLVHLNDFKISGEKGDQAKVSISFVSHGKMTYAKVA